MKQGNTSAVMSPVKKRRAKSRPMRTASDVPSSSVFAEQAINAIIPPPSPRTPGASDTYNSSGQSDHSDSLVEPFHKRERRELVRNDLERGELDGSSSPEQGDEDFKTFSSPDTRLLLRMLNENCAGAGGHSPLGSVDATEAIYQYMQQVGEDDDDDDEDEEDEKPEVLNGAEQRMFNIENFPRPPRPPSAGSTTWKVAVNPEAGGGSGSGGQPPAVAQLAHDLNSKWAAIQREHEARRQAAAGGATRAQVVIPGSQMTILTPQPAFVAAAPTSLPLEPAEVVVGGGGVGGGGGVVGGAGVGLVSLPSAFELNASVYGGATQWQPEEFSEPSRQAHNAKERHRRARIKLACERLRELVPGIGSKTDKATALEFAVFYIEFMRRLLGPAYDKEFLRRHRPF